MIIALIPILVDPHLIVGGQYTDAGSVGLVERFPDDLGIAALELLSDGSPEIQPTRRPTSQVSIAMIIDYYPETIVLGYLNRPLKICSVVSTHVVLIGLVSAVWVEVNPDRVVTERLQFDQKELHASGRFSREDRRGCYGARLVDAIDRGLIQPDSAPSYQNRDR